MLPVGTTSPACGDWVQTTASLETEPRSTVATRPSVSSMARAFTSSRSRTLGTCECRFSEGALIPLSSFTFWLKSRIARNCPRTTSAITARTPSRIRRLRFLCSCLGTALGPPSDPSSDRGRSDLFNAGSPGLRTSKSREQTPLSIALKRRLHECRRVPDRFEDSLVRCA